VVARAGTLDPKGSRYTGTLLRIDARNKTAPDRLCDPGCASPQVHSHRLCSRRPSLANDAE